MIRLMTRNGNAAFNTQNSASSQLIAVELIEPVETNGLRQTQAAPTPEY